MSEQKSYTTVEEAITDLLDGENKENALNITAYLKENNMPPNMTNWGKVRYNDEYNIGRMTVEEKNNWEFEIFDFLHFGNFSDEDEEFTRVVHDHVKICPEPCHDCWRAKDVKIFGKEFKSVCSQHSRVFANPDSKTIEHIKKLIEYRKIEKPYIQQYHSYN